MADIQDVVIALINTGSIKDWKEARVALLGLRHANEQYTEIKGVPVERDKFVAKFTGEKSPP